MSRLPAVGEIIAERVTLSFQIAHAHNRTLKESLLRRRGVDDSTLWVLRDVDLRVAPGEAVGIIGRNGAGKSSILKLFAGTLQPDSGEVRTGGEVAAMLELGAGFHPDFTGRENAYLNGAIHGLSGAEMDERMETIVEFAGIPEFLDMPVRTYSSGMYMRLAFAIAAHLDPDVLLLDEVLAVGDAEFQEKCRGRIIAFRDRGGTLALVSHDAAAIREHCTRAVWLEDGRVVADGEPDAVLLEYHAYLGNHGRRALLERSGSAAGDVDMGVWGGEGVRIADACLAPVRPGRPPLYQSAEALAVAFAIEGDQAAKEEVVVRIAVHSVEGVLAFIAEIPWDGEARRLALEMESLPLNEGLFVVTLSLESSDGSRVYHRLDRWLDFGVARAGTTRGPVNPCAIWRLG